MKCRTDQRARMQGLIDAAVRGEIDEPGARRLYQLGPEAVILALLTSARRLAELQLRIAQLESREPIPGRHDASLPGEASQSSLSTPSAMQPVYQKENRARGRKRRPGARNGHPGARRAPPERIDRREEHRAPCCPDCGGPLQRCRRQRSRVIEDIPEHLQPVITEHVIHRDYCAKCRKHVEPAVPDALPRAALGHHVVALTSWLHYGLGVTIDRIVDIFSYHLHTQVTPGGLVDMWRRLAEILAEWYEQIAAEARSSTHLHADETGWRVGGATWWLWCFTNDRNCYYMIDRNRGSPALQKFFLECFEGVLITDFWRAYDSVCAGGRQFCLVHLLRELESVDEHNAAGEWRAFSKMLRRLIRDAIRLRKRPDFTPQRYASRIQRIDARLCDLADAGYADADAKRLADRLSWTRDHLWTFLDVPEVTFDNNFAERQIRPAVLLRRNGQNNRSARGAAVQSVLMSVYRTLRLRGHNPMKTIAAALRTYIATDKLPPLPA
jgi:transposase